MRQADRIGTPVRFDGLRALVVEDETIVSFLIEDMLMELGCAEVWHAASVSDAIRLLGERRPDLAVVDVNLGGEPSYAVAEQLAAAGVPFAFATGYGQTGILVPWASRPVVQKPFQLEALAAALSAALRAGRPRQR